METLINGDEDFMTNASTPRGKWRHALFFHITATLRSPLTRTVLMLPYYIMRKKSLDNLFLSSYVFFSDRVSCVQVTPKTHMLSQQGIALMGFMKPI
ncbi:hypothetical protein YC2023_040238 [Brassica napus]